MNSQSDPIVPDRTSVERIKLEVAVRMEEYKGLRAEILGTLSAAQLTTSLTLTASGILIAGGPFIVQNRAPYLFLLASYGFFLIAWTQLRYGQVVFNLSEHISKVVAPGVRRALTEMRPSEGGTIVDILIWESTGRTHTHPAASWTLPVEASRHALPIVAAVGAAVAFAINSSQLSGGYWWAKFFLWPGVASCAALLGYTLCVAMRVRKQLRGASK